MEGDNLVNTASQVRSFRNLDDGPSDRGIEHVFLFKGAFGHEVWLFFWHPGPITHIVIREFQIAIAVLVTVSEKMRGI